MKTAEIIQLGDGRIKIDSEIYVNEKSQRVMSQKEFELIKTKK